MGQDHARDPDGEPGVQPDDHSSSAGVIDPVIARYGRGEISAMQAASLLGGRTTVADVVVMLGRAGLPPPEPPLERQRAELAHALKLFGLVDP